MTKSNTTVTINGRIFDVKTGMPLTSPAVTVQPFVPRPSGQRTSFDIKPATQLHSGPARSQALRRSSVKRPAAQVTLARHAARVITPVPTHPDVQRFSAVDVPVTPSQVLAREDSVDLSPAREAQFQNYTPAASLAAPPKATRPVSKKQQVVAKQLADAPFRAERPKAEKTKRRRRLSGSLIISGAILIVIGGFILAYLTVPALSLFVGAQSAGIAATYPNYTPPTYSFSGPVSYRDDEVTINFKSNNSDQHFSIEQKKSSWDPDAVLDNYVLARSSTYLTYSQKGLTIYTFGTEAAWVNAGILHTITGNAHLTNDQVLHLVGSM